MKMLSLKLPASLHIQLERPAKKRGVSKSEVVRVALEKFLNGEHGITPGSALDKEALKRGNSAYFPDRVVPMLPEELSADLCSLKEGVDRPCLVARMVFDRHGRKKSHVFQRAIMRSAARLTYIRVQEAHDGRGDAPIPLAPDRLRALYGAFAALDRMRQISQQGNMRVTEVASKIISSGQSGLG